MNAARFRNEAAARERLESIRWPQGAACPHCGSTERNSKLHGASHRAGLWFCGDCREQFSVTVGTVFERSKIPVSKWLMAVHLLCSSKKGISSYELHRVLGVTYKTAWFMTHRIRHAMTTEAGLMGSGGGIVEADETHIGRKPGRKMKPRAEHKHMVFTLVERGGRAHSVHITGKTFAGIKKALKVVSPSMMRHALSTRSRPSRGSD
jgi:transposase-like protein